MDVVKQYYDISGILGDDTYKVATVVQRYHDTDIYHSFILADLQNASYDRLAKYEDTFDLILGEDISTIKEASKNITFATKDCYMEYLQDLLKTFNIPFIAYRSKSQAREAERVSSLFEGVTE